MPVSNWSGWSPAAVCVPHNRPSQEDFTGCRFGTVTLNTAFAGGVAELNSTTRTGDGAPHSAGLSFRDQRKQITASMSLSDWTLLSTTTRTSPPRGCHDVAGSRAIVMSVAGDFACAVLQRSAGSGVVAGGAAGTCAPAFPATSRPSHRQASAPTRAVRDRV